MTCATRSTGENDTEKILLDSLLFLQRAPIVKATHTTENSPKRRPLRQRAIVFERLYSVSLVSSFYNWDL
ncbi:hypothetical protein CLI77_08165 [Porphyromonas gingivalis]|nr:hypothetical protein CLI77_08165 [Porphyromonas gingivalis]PDP62328.1 hypothetical protein CLI83_06265 [Porphyromonas gingivalis]PDP75556.1 hypothetical protein CLI79_03540 [Porphyromonas gingivalis]